MSITCNVLRATALTVWLVAPAGGWLAAADCNENGFTDAEEVRTRLHLEPRSTYAVGDSSDSVYAVDLNGDGAIDILNKSLGTWDSSTSRYLNASLSVLLNLGDGSLQAATDVPAGDQLGALAIADWNADGSLDLATSTFGRWDGRGYVDCGLDAFLGRGDGTFAAPRRIAEGCYGEIGLADMAAADLDSDGDADLATAESIYGSLIVLRNLGEGRFAPEAKLFHGHPVTVRAADLDGDQDLDLVGLGDWFAVHPNRGDGTFLEPRGFLAEGSPRFPVMTDLDRDGDVDIALAGSIALVWNMGDGTFPAWRSLEAFGGAHFLTAADLEVDGDLDLVALDGFLGVSAFLNKGTGAFEAQAIAAPVQGLSSLTAADLDADGDPDLAAVLRDSSELLILRNDTLPPLSPDCNRNGLPDGCDIASGVSVDGDRDGVPDDCSLCPMAGDTHCVAFAADVSDFGVSHGVVLARGSARDDSGDAVRYTFTASGGHGGPIVVGPQAEDTAVFEVSSGAWTITMTVDDDSTCDDEAADASCSASVYVPHIDFGPFLRADTDSSGAHDLTDAIVIFGYLFLGFRVPGCLASADTNLDAVVDISDGVYFLNYQFLGGGAPPGPFPYCGFSSYESDLRLGCEALGAGC